MKEKNWYVVEEYAFRKSDVQHFKYESKEAAEAAVMKHFYDSIKVLKKDGAKLVKYSLLGSDALGIFSDGYVKMYVAEI